MIITKVQLETLEFIDDWIKEIGYSPSIREMIDGLGLKSPAPVQARLTQLRDSGLIEWIPGIARTVRLTEQGKEALGYKAPQTFDEKLEAFLEETKASLVATRRGGSSTQYVLSVREGQ